MTGMLHSSPPALGLGKVSKVDCPEKKAAVLEALAR